MRDAEEGRREDKIKHTKVNYTEVLQRIIVLAVTSSVLKREKQEMAVRKKSGAPDPKYFESSDTIAKFEPVRQWLLKNCRKVGNKLIGRSRKHVILVNAHHCGRSDV